MKAKIDSLFQRDYDYAAAHDYKCSTAALEYIKTSYIDVENTMPMVQEYLIHGLSIAWLLIELRLPVTEKEMDLMLSASVLHILAEMYEPYDIEGTVEQIGLSKNVADFVNDIVTSNQDFDKIVGDRLLLMVKMVERSNLIEHLCDMSIEEAKHFRMDAKRFWFAACVEGKACYQEFDMALSGILEKMRGLIQVMDILFKRYEDEEDELYEEILLLKEENARIRVALEKRQKFIK